MKTINNKIFKSIPGYDGYYASYDGEIYSEKSDRIRKINYSTGSVEYPTLALYDDNVCTCVPVHKLVALAWIPLPQGYVLKDVLGNWMCRKLVADHIDGDKKNFKASNLRWCSPFENSNFDNVNRAKRVEALKGNTNAKNKKTPENSGKIRYIYHYNGKDYTIQELCAELDCTKSKITESFRRNLGLVRAGKLTRTPVLAKSYKEELITELEALVIALGDNINDETNPGTIRASEILTIIATHSKENE